MCDKELKELQDALANAGSDLEKWHIIDEYTGRHADMWTDEMGEDTMDFFCSDCGSMLSSFYNTGELCAACEEDYNELWGEDA